MAEMRIKGAMGYQKQIIMFNPDAHAEVTLKFEGLTENGSTEMREIFEEFFANIVGIVKTDVGLYGE